MQTILLTTRHMPEQDKAFVERLQVGEIKKFDQPVYAYFALLNRRRETYRYVACFCSGEVDNFQRSAREFGLETHKRSFFGKLTALIGMRAPMSFPDRPVDEQGLAENECGEAPSLSPSLNQSN
ncbi:hypothetical protein BZM27_06125 [Paraburkholderia steynii]|uniref:Uncharacterized protein n=1 Tax=Paraburkholderia steynii TaxID=1245441 RepID=A0A4R0XGE1_9BURK|nr:hypothetical protein BZM27_06125 [Paraburkholderia steynii]